MIPSALRFGMPWNLEHDRHGPVVDELDGHLRTEHALLDLYAESAQPGAEAVVHRLGLLRRRSLGERRPVALRRIGQVLTGN
jgi:hypothetical protein